MLKVLSRQPDAFGSADVEVLTALAGFIATAVNRAHVFEETRRRASTDPLAGLVNRSVLMEHLLQGLARAARNGTVVGVVFIDLDGFKPVNDTYGHEAGDRGLVEVGRRLGNTRTGDTVARPGGDEFAIVTENRTRESVLSLAERLHAVIGAPIDASGVTVCVRASVGVATAEGADNAESLLSRADAAMYGAKRRGTLTRAGDRLTDPSPSDCGQRGRQLDEPVGVERRNPRYDDRSPQQPRDRVGEDEEHRQRMPRAPRCGHHCPAQPRSRQYPSSVQLSRLLLAVCPRACPQARRATPSFRQ